MIERHLKPLAFGAEFGRQMRFIAGPRQCGKTTLAKTFLAEQGMESLYFNWDLPALRDLYRRDSVFFESALRDAHASKGMAWLCLDEIHKLPKWKNLLKGYFDQFEDICRLIVTGSARLDWFRRSGDSLAGRYFLFRLGPLLLAEVVGANAPYAKKGMMAAAWIEKQIASTGYAQGTMEDLLQYSGFPEPLLRAKNPFHARWQRDMIDRVVREDIRDLTRILDIENTIHLLRLLPGRVGSPLSINSLKEDLSNSYTAVRNAVMALQFAYLVYLVPPFQRNIARSLKKEKKCYLFDWSLVPDPAKRFENYVAHELKSRVDLWSDSGEIEAELYYVRTKDGKETDFLITIDGTPWCLFEVKLSKTDLASHNLAHARLLGDIPIVQLTHEPGVLKRSGSAFSISASRFFK